jgi:hypothetical protein
MCINPKCKKEAVTFGKRKTHQLFCEDCLQMPFERRLKIAKKYLEEPRSLQRLNKKK